MSGCVLSTLLHDTTNVMKNIGAESCKWQSDDGSSCDGLIRGSLHRTETLRRLKPQKTACMYASVTSRNQQGKVVPSGLTKYSVSLLISTTMWCKLPSTKANSVLYSLKTGIHLERSVHELPIETARESTQHIMHFLLTPGFLFHVTDCLLYCI